MPVFLYLQREMQHLMIFQDLKIQRQLLGLNLALHQVNENPNVFLCDPLTSRNQLF